MKELGQVSIDSQQQYLQAASENTTVFFKRKDDIKEVRVILECYVWENK